MLARRMLFGALAVGAALVAALAAAGGLGSGVARAAGQPETAVAPHVVIVGLSGLRWTDVSASATPALWAEAHAGSPGSLVDFAVGPHTCPADAWLTLNGGDRAQVPHAGDGACPALPAVTVVRPGPAGGPGARGRWRAAARVAAMPSLVAYNRTLKYSPRWGLLASAAGPGGCATAVGPGAALALAGPGGAVGSYLPGAAGLSRAVLARCPLTVVDLGSLPGGRRAGPGRRRWRAPTGGWPRWRRGCRAGRCCWWRGWGAAAVPPHLQAVLVSGPGYRSGLLAAVSTRQAGMVVLTDLTPTVLGWRGQPRPAGLPGAQITRAARPGPFGSTVRGLIGQDTTAQVWAGTHSVFYWSYVVLDLVVFAGIGLLFWGGAPGRRRRAGVVVAGGGDDAGGGAGGFVSWPMWCRGGCWGIRRCGSTGWPWRGRRWWAGWRWPGRGGGIRSGRRASWRRRRC